MSISLNQVRAAQRANPQAPETKALQKAYAEQENRAKRTQAAIEHAEQYAADCAQGKTIETCPARDHAEVWGIVGQDVDMQAARKFIGQFVDVTACLALVEDGELHGWVNGPEIHRVKIVDVRFGSHWSDQSSGRSGYHLAYTVLLPDALRTAARIELA